MDQLLSHYEQELGMLRRASQQFAHRHPTLAQELGLSADASADPEVERLLQSVALLNASTSRNIATAHQRLTAALLGNDKLRAQPDLPHAAIAQASGGRAQATRIPKGTEFWSQAATGHCRFRTTMDVDLVPVAIDACRYLQSINVPSSLQVPAHAAASIELRLRGTEPGKPLAQYGVASLRLYLDTDAPTRAALLDAIFTRTLATCVESAGQWRLAEKPPFTLPLGEGVQLAEYFAYPDHLAFLDVDLSALLKLFPQAEQLRIVLALPDRRNTSPARLLFGLHAASLRLGCSPVINAYEAAALPIRLAPGRATYPLHIAERFAEEMVPHAIDSVRLVRRASGETESVPPLDGMNHADASLFWRFGPMSSGHGITLIDREGQEAVNESGVLTATLHCTDGAAPGILKPGADLICRNGAIQPLRLITQPAQSKARLPEQEEQWQLLSPPHLHLGAVADALRNILRLHGGDTNGSLIDAIRAVHYTAATTWHEGSYLHGMSIEVLIDHERSLEHSMVVFAHVLSRWFRSMSREGSFTQLTLISATAGTPIVCCAPLTGTEPLI